MTDEDLIKQTLRLAQKGRGKVNPNPMVGAIIVKNGEIIARGYHRRFGEVHAEVDCINSAREDLAGSTLYVNLEPCSHHGKQPPCVQKIVDAGIEKVVFGSRDPNPAVNGRGVQFLQEKGLLVKAGVLIEACNELNQAFFKHVTTGVPFVTLKIAQTLDGKIAAADGGSKWITGDAAQVKTHRMRSKHDAILAGIGTVLSDDPQLNVRHIRGPSPARVIVDSKLRIPLQAKILNDDLVHKTIIATAKSCDTRRAVEIKNKGADVWQISRSKHGGLNLKELCQKLGDAGIVSILIEGGSGIFSSFLRERLVDRLELFLAGKVLGSGLTAMRELGINSLNESIMFKNMSCRKVGTDILISADVEKPINLNCLQVNNQQRTTLN